MAWSGAPSVPGSARSDVARVLDSMALKDDSVPKQVARPAQARSHSHDRHRHGVEPLLLVRHPPRAFRAEYEHQGRVQP